MVKLKYDLCFCFFTHDKKPIHRSIKLNQVVILCTSRRYCHHIVRPRSSKIRFPAFFPLQSSFWDLEKIAQNQGPCARFSIRLKIVTLLCALSELVRVQILDFSSYKTQVLNFKFWSSPLKMPLVKRRGRRVPEGSKFRQRHPGTFTLLGHKRRVDMASKVPRHKV